MLVRQNHAFEKETWGLCKDCYGIIPANFDGTTMTKECPVHGVQSAVIDPEEGFYERVSAMPRNENIIRIPHTALSVTNRCNLRCPGCYALPDNSVDDGIDSIVKVASNANGKGLVLMGSEPTMRDDLNVLIKELSAFKKPVSIYTNGIRLSDEKYLAGLEEAGLFRIVLSLHLPSYVGKKAFNTKLKAIENISKTSVGLDYVSFSLRTITEVEEALQYIMSIDFNIFSSRYVRLRAPSELGGVRNKPCTMSDFFNAVWAACEKLGYKVEVSPFTNHIYAIMLSIEGRQVLLIRWPTVEEVNLIELQKGPVSALFVPEIGETQIIHQGMITERIRSGGAHPPKPPANCPSYISGRAA